VDNVTATGDDDVRPLFHLPIYRRQGLNVNVFTALLPQFWTFTRWGSNRRRNAYQAETAVWQLHPAERGGSSTLGYGSYG
jgi:hypothetical protein